MSQRVSSPATSLRHQGASGGLGVPAAGETKSGSEASPSLGRLALGFGTSICRAALVTVAGWGFECW